MISLLYHGAFSEIRLIPFLFLLAAVENAARLINCSAQDLVLALSTHKIQAGKDFIAKKLTMQKVCLDLDLKIKLPLHYSNIALYLPNDTH
jgi:hypothetical protein